MKRNAISAVPAIPVRAGQVATKIDLKELGQVNVGLVTNTLRKGDVFEFPDTVEDVEVFKQPFANGTNYLILGLRNEKAYWLSLGSIRRRDMDNKPVHAVAEYVLQCETMDEVVLAMLGKKIVGDGDVTYNAMTFVDGRPTGEGESKTVANLRFA